MKNSVLAGLIATDVFLFVASGHFDKMWLSKLSSVFNMVVFAVCGFCVAGELLGVV